MKPKLRNERHCTQNMPSPCREELCECYYSLYSCRWIACSPSSLIPPWLSLLPLLSVLKAIRTDFKLMIWSQCDNSSCTQLHFESSVSVTQKQGRFSDALYSLYSVLPSNPMFLPLWCHYWFSSTSLSLDSDTYRVLFLFFIAFLCAVCYFSVCHILPMISLPILGLNHTKFSIGLARWFSG